MKNIRTETDVMNMARIKASKHGVLLYRNNVGAVLTQGGSYVRYGLLNDSTQLNNKIKSADLIGITPKVVTQDMIGALIGVFTAVEAKYPGWRYDDNDTKDTAQGRFLRLVERVGGIAYFTDGEFRYNHRGEVICRDTYDDQE